MTPADPADQRRGELDPAPAGRRTGRGAAVGPLAAGAGVAGAHVGAQRLAGRRDRGADGPVAAVRRTDRRGADDSAIEDRGAAGRRHRRRPGGGRHRERLLALSRSSTATSTRRSASCTSSRSSRCHPPSATHDAGRRVAQPVAKVPSTLDGDARDDADPRQRPADRDGRRRVRRHGGHGDRRGPDRGDRRRRPRRARRRHARTWSAPATAGRCRACCASTRWPPRPASAPPEGEYETIGGLVLQELGHIPASRRRR